MFDSLIKKIPENINKGISVIKGIKATFAPVRIPWRRVSEIISTSIGPGANPAGAPKRNPTISNTQILSIIPGNYIQGTPNQVSFY